MFTQTGTEVGAYVKYEKKLLILLISTLTLYFDCDGAIEAFIILVTSLQMTSLLHTKHQLGLY